MAKASKSQKTARRNLLIYKAALVIISTVVLVWFMPRGDSALWHYDENRPWRYGQLLAKFDFPIYKTEDEMSREKDSAMTSMEPYFNVKSVDLSAKSAQLDDIIKKMGGNKSSNYKNHVLTLLDSVYKRGVISCEEYNKIEKLGCHSIKVVDNSIATSVSFDNVLSKIDAYELIMSADTVNYSRLIMADLNINDLLEPNLTLDNTKYNTELKEKLANISPSSGTVQKGQQIIDKGEIITHDKYKILVSYEKEFSKHDTETTVIPYRLIGQIVFVLAIMLILVSYLSLFRKDYFDDYRSGIMLFGFPMIFCIFAFLMETHTSYNVFMIPCCMVPIVIRIFMDSRTAFMFHTAMVIIISPSLHFPYEFVILQLLTGMIAIQTLRELTQRSQIIRTTVLITLCYIIFYTSYELLLENTYEKLDKSMYYYFLYNGGFLLFTYPLLWLIEKGFGFVSDVTLVELSNINNPLLQRMSEVAPGTFQHSLMVSNLCAEVAKKIDARSQLVRTAALYHDIGKIERPVFFTENQSGVSPHKHLSPQKSAEVIIAHVTNGLALADRNNLPKLIKNFIASHHGRGLTKYFYITYKNEHPDEEVNESLFRYPGPNPTTKEEAILMMADAVEAASRSLKEYTEESISQLVDNIVDSQVNDCFFAECDITFRDIITAKEVFKEKLKIVYHTRISYPELNSKDNDKQQQEAK